MIRQDMYTLYDVSRILRLNINTFRYQLKKNSKDCEDGIYEVCLYDFISKIKMKTKIQKANYIRICTRYIILDAEEFINEFKKYMEFLKDKKNRRRNFRQGWSTSAIECYERKMRCRGCKYHNICKRVASKNNNIPPMKKVVHKLLIELGLPPKL